MMTRKEMKQLIAQADSQYDQILSLGRDVTAQNLVAFGKLKESVRNAPPPEIRSLSDDEIRFICLFAAIGMNRSVVAFGQLWLEASRG